MRRYTPWMIGSIFALMSGLAIADPIKYSMLVGYGTITTDGTIGAIDSASIIAWDIRLPYYSASFHSSSTDPNSSMTCTGVPSSLGCMDASDTQLTQRAPTVPGERILQFSEVLSPGIVESLVFSAIRYSDGSDGRYFLYTYLVGPDPTQPPQDVLNCGPGIGAIGCTVFIAGVPEPGSLACIAASLVVGLAFRRRTRKT